MSFPELTGLTDAPRTVRELLASEGVEPTRPITYHAIRGLILDGEVRAERIGGRLFLARAELLKVASRHGLPLAPSA